MHSSERGRGRVRGFEWLLPVDACPLNPTQAPHVPRNLRNAPKRTAGILQKWDSERGFGFIHEEDDTCAVDFKLTKGELLWILHSVLTTPSYWGAKMTTIFFSVFCWKKMRGEEPTNIFLHRSNLMGSTPGGFKSRVAGEMRPVVDVFGRCLLADGSSTTTFMFWLSFGI